MNRPLMITGLFAGTMGLAATAQAQSQAQAQAQDCDAILVLHDVRSAGVLAQADRFILENGYGCDAETVAGDTVPTTTSMVEKGEPDVSSDTHAGTPMRVTTGAIPHIPGASVYDKMKWLEEKDDGLRKLLLRQPRG